MYRDCNFSQVGLLSSHLIASAKPVRNIPNLELWQKSTPINQVDSSHYKILIRNSSLDTDVCIFVLKTYLIY